MTIFQAFVNKDSFNCPLDLIIFYLSLFCIFSSSCGLAPIIGPQFVGALVFFSKLPIGHT